MTEAASQGGTGYRIGYARCSTDKQDLRAQKAELAKLGPDRVFTDEGFTGSRRDTRAGLDQAMAALREGDTLIVTRLDRLARSVPDARAIADEIHARGARLQLGSMVYDPHDPMGKMFFTNLATFAEFEAEMLRMRTREGMAEARRAGKLRGKPPKFSRNQDREVRRMRDSGDYTIGEIAELLSVSRTTIYRSLDRTAAASAEAYAAVDAAQIPGQTSIDQHEQPPEQPSGLDTSVAADETSSNDSETATSAASQPPKSKPAGKAAAAATNPAPARRSSAGKPAVAAPGGPAASRSRRARPVGADELVDVNTAVLSRNAVTGAYRVTAATISNGETVHVGLLERDPRKASRWHARTPVGLDRGGAHRTRQEALVALLEPHYRGQK